MTYDGEATNLHHIWDSDMPEQLVGGSSLSDAQTWAENLTTEIKSGSYASSAPSWLDGMDVDDVESSAMVWATETNKFVCSTVMPGGREAVETGDLSGDYYESSIGVIEERIARGEYFPLFRCRRRWMLSSPATSASSKSVVFHSGPAIAVHPGPNRSNVCG